MPGPKTKQTPWLELLSQAQPGPRGIRVGPSVEGLYRAPWIEAHAAVAGPPGQTAYNRATGYLGSLEKLLWMR